MRRFVLIGVALVTTLAAQRAEANQCNLYQPQQWGQFREGCSTTIFALPEVDPLIPIVKRNGVVIPATIMQDEIVLKVGFEHYPSPDSCRLLPPEYENKTFERYVVTWALKGGDEIMVDSIPYTVVVPGPGDCGVVDPTFWCQDGIQSCDDPVNPGDPDPDHEDDSDLGGCSAGRSSTSWLVIVAALGFVPRRRRS
jgi:hypothetical protein